jgi:hypothetical protein
MARLADVAQKAALDLGATIVPGGRGKPRPANQPVMGRPGGANAIGFPPGVVPGVSAAPTYGMAPAAPLVGLATGLPSRAVILSNMFDPSEEEGDSWDLDIHDDVKEECEKFGPVLHVSVQKDSAGVVYVLFG